MSRSQSPEIFTLSNRSSPSSAEESSNHKKKVSGHEQKSSSGRSKGSNGRKKALDSEERSSHEQETGLEPVPFGWEQRHDSLGQIYFVDHSTRSSAWTDARFQPNHTAGFSPIDNPHPTRCGGPVATKNIFGQTYFTQRDHRKDRSRDQRHSTPGLIPSLFGFSDIPRSPSGMQGTQLDGSMMFTGGIDIPNFPPSSANRAPLPPPRGFSPDWPFSPPRAPAGFHPSSWNNHWWTATGTDADTDHTEEEQPKPKVKAKKEKQEKKARK